MYSYASSSRAVPGDPVATIERFVDDPTVWLPPPAESLGHDRWRTSVHIRRLRRQVTMHLQPTWTMPDTWIRAVSWTPSARHGIHEHVARYLPTFSGRLTLRTAEDGQLILEADGSYVPPFGRTGAMADVLGLHRAADATVAELVNDIAEALALPTPMPGARAVPTAG